MQKKLLLFYALLLASCVMPTYGQAQLSPPPNGDFVYDIRVDEVDVLAPTTSPACKLPLVRDYSPNPPIDGPAWKFPDTQKPVAFASGCTPRVTAKFVGCSGATWAKGDGPGGFDLPAKQLTSSVYTAEPFQTGFPSNTVDFYDPFEINWFVSTSASGPWVPAGKSSHPLYVIYNTSPVSGSVYYHTLLYYGCRTGKGLSNKDKLTDAIYNGSFLGQKLVRKDSPTKLDGMSYWGTVNSAPEPLCFTTQGLLQYEDGRCGAWSSFLVDMLVAQGITTAQKSFVTWLPSMVVDPIRMAIFNSDRMFFFGSEANHLFYPSQLGAAFFVKNFNISNNIAFNIWDSEYQPGGNTSSVTLLNLNTLVLAPENGVSGQGNLNPQSTFVDHTIVKYTYADGSSKYLDPSYGAPMMATANDWENYALDGFGNSQCVYVKYVGGIPILTRKVMWVYETNSVTQQCNIAP